MQAVNQSPSCALQHQGPLAKPEVDSLTLLFRELVLADKELIQIEELRGPNRDRMMAIETQEVMQNLKVNNGLSVTAAAKFDSLHHQENCEDLDKKFNIARQKFLHTTFKVVAYLRTLNEYIAWECDLSFVINAMKQVNGILKKALGEERIDPSYAMHCEHMDEEIEQHKDQSSELFLRTAYGIAVLVKEVPEDDENMSAGKLSQLVSVKCVRTFEAFRKNLSVISEKDPVFPEGYETFVLSLKAFGLSFKNYKSVASTITGAQCLQPFAPHGTCFAVKIPDLEL